MRRDFCHCLTSTLDEISRCRGVLCCSFLSKKMLRRSTGLDVADLCFSSERRELSPKSRTTKPGSGDLLLATTTYVGAVHHVTVGNHILKTRRMPLDAVENSRRRGSLYFRAVTFWFPRW